MMKLILLLLNLLVAALALGDLGEDPTSTQGVDDHRPLRASAGVSLLEGQPLTAHSQRMLKKPKKPKNNVKLCSSTKDCASDGSQYCAKGTCLATGKCTTHADCFNPENLYAVILCVGPISCTAGQCGKTCSSSDCPSGTPPVQCVVSPCQNVATTCSVAVSNCVDYYCGACKFFAFDKAGYEVCKS
jgi:hypothetical protein